MKPVTVSVDASRAPSEVREFLDVLANHELFTDHLFTDWRFSGPSRGVGARARARANVPASQDWTEFEIVESNLEAIVEEGVGAGGTRRTRGTYRFAELPSGGTRISFELAWLEASRIERFGAPLTRAFVRRANGRSIRRLAKQLDRG